MSRLSRPLVQPLLGFAAKLRSSSLLAAVTALFVLDVLIPDVIPFVDEILLGAAALLLARRRGKS